jgi:hypothetical protein
MLQGESCTAQLAKKYKFLLAFESDICTDFVSFKLFSILQESTTVAVVMGGADYASITPPMSVINVADFKSAKDLANYLLFLDAHSGTKLFKISGGGNCEAISDGAGVSL